MHTNSTHPSLSIDFMLQICCHKATNCLEQAESSALLPIHPPKDPRISTTAQGHRKEIHHLEPPNPNASPRLFLGPWCCASDIGTVEFFSSNSIALLLLVSLCYLLFLGWFEANELGLFGEKKNEKNVLRCEDSKKGRRLIKSICINRPPKTTTVSHSDL